MLYALTCTQTLRMTLSSFLTTTQVATRPLAPATIYNCGKFAPNL
jgi:hypothetical protein